MSFIIYSGSNAPEPTNVLLGLTTDNFFRDVTQFTPEHKAIYNAFFNAVGSYTTVRIINSPYTLTVDHVTPNSVSLEVIELDYLSLSQVEKDAIDNAVLMFSSSIAEKPLLEP